MSGRGRRWLNNSILLYLCINKSLIKYYIYYIEINLKKPPRLDNLKD